MKPSREHTWEASRQLRRAAFIHNWSFLRQPEKRVIKYSMAGKTFATEAALEATRDAIQIYGGIYILTDLRDFFPGKSSPF